MKSSVPDERSYTLGPAIPKPVTITPKKPTPVNSKGTIVEIDGKFQTRLPDPPPKYTSAPYIPPDPIDYEPMCVPYMAEDGTIQPVTEELILRLCGDEFNTGGYYDGAEWVPLAVWE